MGKAFKRSSRLREIEPKFSSITGCNNERVKNAIIFDIICWSGDKSDIFRLQAVFQTIIMWLIYAVNNGYRCTRDEILFFNTITTGSQVQKKLFIFSLVF